MDKAQAFPKTLQEAVIHFKDFDNCMKFMVELRWPDGKVLCPNCGSDDVDYLPNARVFKCYQKHERQKFSLKVGTIFEDSPLGLEKWLPVMWMLVNCKNGVSSWEIHRSVGVTQKTAWFMLQRCRLAMQDNVTGGKLGGEVEVDETFIGGKARNMHADVKARKIRGRGTEGKAIVAAVLERGGRVRAKVVSTRRKKDLQALVRENVEVGSNLYSDALKSYEGPWRGFHPSGDRPRRSLRRRPDPHQQRGELLELAKARDQRDLRFGRAVSPVQVCRRAELPLQHQKGYE